jgi:NDP-sugar pyrophosphorylase family protein
MKAMILAGGLSTRLYPLTKTVPKPLVPIAGEPIAGHVARYLRSFGIDEIAINVHYHAEQIEARLGTGAEFGVRFHYLREPVLLGSAGAVKQMEGFFNDTFVVIGCDVLTDVGLDRLVAFHRQRGATATIGLVEAVDVSQYGVVVVDDDGKICEFQEKPAPGTERSHLVNTAVYVFEPEVLGRIRAGEFYDFGKQVFPEMLGDAVAFYGLAMPGAYWCDVGTLPEYRRGTRDALEGSVRMPGMSRPRGVAPSARVSSRAKIEGSVRIGERSSLADGAVVVGPSVIGADVVVDADARIERSIVWDRAHIGESARLVDAIVGVDYEVAPRTNLDSAIVAREEASAPRPS